MNFAVSLFSAALALIAAAPGWAATLKVGPGQKYAKPSAAFQAARNGDVIEIATAGDYGGDVATITRDKLTVRGVGHGRVKIPAKGRIEGGKAIWVIRGHYVTVENIEFSAARAGPQRRRHPRPKARSSPSAAAASTTARTESSAGRARC